MSEWSEEREAQFTELWMSGKSASQIADIMGTTRSAVCGKARRLKLPNRAIGKHDTVRLPKPARLPKAKSPVVTPVTKPVLRDRDNEERPAPRRAVLPLPMPRLDAPAPAFKADGSKHGLLDLSDKTCKWPIGTPSDEGFPLLRKCNAYWHALLPISREAQLSASDARARSMTRAAPDLTPERRAHLSASMKDRHAQDPQLRRRLGNAAAKAYAKRARDADYRDWRARLAEEARLDPKRGINLRSYLRERWADEDERAIAADRLRAQRADPEFNRRTVEARWTKEKRIKAGRDVRRMWAERRAMVAELRKRGLLRKKQRRPGKIAGVILKALHAARITLDELRQKTRKHFIVRTRMEVARALRRSGFSLPVIGLALGLNHTTVLHAVRKGARP